jgi:hypothetical protein
MRTVIKVENNLKEILTFLEGKGYKWHCGNKPTDGLSWGSRFIVIEDKILTHRTVGNEPKAITLEQFKKELSTMKTTYIMPGYKLVLENGSTFVVMEYKHTKIVFPEGSSRSVTALDEICDIDLTPKSGVSRIMKILNALNIPVWERKFTRNDLKAGFTMTNENDANYLIVEKDCNLRIMSTELFVVGPKLCDIMNEDMSPTDSDYAEVIEVRDKEGKIVYSKK